MAIGATLVGDELDVGRSLAVAAAPAANGLDESIRARGRGQNHRNLGCLWESLVQFGPTRHLLIGQQDDLGLTWCVDRFGIPTSQLESLAGFVCPIGAIDKSCHFLRIPGSDRGSFLREGWN